MTTSKVFLLGDSEPLWINEPPDVLISRLAEAVTDEQHMSFVRVETVPYTLDDHPRPAYINVASIAAVAPTLQAELDWHYANPPDFLAGD